MLGLHYPGKFVFTILFTQHFHLLNLNLPHLHSKHAGLFAFRYVSATYIWYQSHKTPNFPIFFTIQNHLPRLTTVLALGAPLCLPQRTYASNSGWLAFAGLMVTENIKNRYCCHYNHHHHSLLEENNSNATLYNGQNANFISYSLPMQLHFLIAWVLKEASDSCRAFNAPFPHYPPY